MLYGRDLCEERANKGVKWLVKCLQKKTESHIIPWALIHFRWPGSEFLIEKKEIKEKIDGHFCNDSVLLRIY